MDLNIFIPTKARYDNCKTANLIGDYKNLFLVVEPQEYKEYSINYPNFNILQLPENNKGIVYVRNYIKQYTESKGIKEYWQLDDDITSFYYRSGTKLIKDNFEVLQKAQKQFREQDISLGSLEYRQFAWSANKPIILNSFCDSCVYVNNEKTKSIRYRYEIAGKEDRDFAMQVINANEKTGRTTLYAFSAPPNGSNKGGLKEIFYDIKDAELVSCKKMVELWGDDICRHIVKPDGRNDLKINWKNINNNQTKLF
jgi:hypothetical protein